VSTWAAVYGQWTGADGLEHLRAGLQRWPADEEWQWSAPAFGVVCRPLHVRAPHDSAAPPPDAQQVIAFDGRLDNRAGLIAKLHVGADSTDAALVLAAYRQLGERCVSQLEGDFAFCLADLHRGLLLIARDVVGVRPVYFTKTRDAFYCSTRIAPLLRVRAAEPNQAALSWFLCWPHTLGAEETLLHDVHALPPATALLVNARGQRAWKYWEADGAEYAGYSRQKCEEAFRGLFQQAIRSRVRGAKRVAVQVSGGVDSSSVLCVAQAVDVHVFGVYHGTAGGGPDDETEYLDELQRAGSTIHRVGLLPSAFPELVEQTVLQGEFPFVNNFPGATQRVTSCVRELGAHVLLNGTWADQVLFPFPPAYLADAMRNGRWFTVMRHLLTYPKWMADVPRRAIWEAALRGLLRQHAPQRVLRRRRQQRLQDPVARLLHPAHQPALLADDAAIEPWSARRTAHAQAVERNVRSRIDTMSMEHAVKRAATDEVELAFPFLDRELITLLITASPLAHMADGTPKAVLRNAMRGIVPERVRQRRDKGDYSRTVEEETRRAAQRLFEELRNGHAVRSGLLHREWFGSDLRTLQHRLNLAEDQLAPALARVYGVECWLRNFGTGNGPVH
jgi:asparagine synthase (glutamine-hydrolysing)